MGGPSGALRQIRPRNDYTQLENAIVLIVVPAYVVPLFAATTALTVLLMRFVSGSRRVLILLCAWIAVQTLMANTGFYTDTRAMPPRMLLAVGPPLVVIAALFLTRAGRAFLDRLDLRWLTVLHTIRIPVEIVLHALFVAGLVPQVMTYEGRNFDIVSGATAPMVALIAFRQGQPRRGLLLAWNIACLGLLLNIIAHGMLSVPGPLQQFGFEQPNVALLRAPFVWLPALIVPVVLLAHLAAIRQLVRSRMFRSNVARQ